MATEEGECLIYRLNLSKRSRFPEIHRETRSLRREEGNDVMGSTSASAAARRVAAHLAGCTRSPMRRPPGDRMPGSASRTEVQSRGPTPYARSRLGGPHEFRHGRFARVRIRECARIPLAPTPRSANRGRTPPGSGSERPTRSPLVAGRSPARRTPNSNGDSYRAPGTR